MSGLWSPWEVPATQRAGPLGHDPAQRQRWWGQWLGQSEDRGQPHRWGSAGRGDGGAGSWTLPRLCHRTVSGPE